MSPRGAYDRRFPKQLFGDHPIIQLEPAEAKKLIEGAIRFAADYGLAPHADYAKAKLILADVDSSQCDATFEYGRNGEPMLIPGPNDTAARCHQILATMAAHSPQAPGESGSRPELRLTTKG